MSTDRPQRFRYILRKEHIANKKEKGILSRHKTGDEINVLPGTLWEDYEDKQTKKHEKIGFSYFSSLDFENLILSCPPSDVTRINQGEYELLASISTCADRMKVFEDKAWLSEGLTLDVGSYVHIHRYPNLPEKAPGVIKYKGSLSGIKGLWFGVELLMTWKKSGGSLRRGEGQEHRGKGCTNGMFRGHRYFVTDVDCGIFVTIARIRKCPDDNRHDNRTVENRQENRLENKQGTPPQPIYQQHTVRQNATSPPLPNLPPNIAKDRRAYDLKLSERVVWLGDTGPEFGSVRWIGTLPDKPEEVLVGVEFDNAVGSGTGRYKEDQLFRTKPGHASLIPILGLMKEDEYINPTPVKMPIDFYNDRPAMHRRGPTMGMNNAQRMMLKGAGRSQSQGSQDSDDIPPYSVVKKPNRPALWRFWSQGSQDSFEVNDHTSYATLVRKSPRKSPLKKALSRTRSTGSHSPENGKQRICIRRFSLLSKPAFQIPPSRTASLAHQAPMRAETLAILPRFWSQSSQDCEDIPPPSSSSALYSRRQANLHRQGATSLGMIAGPSTSSAGLSSSGAMGSGSLDGHASPLAVKMMGKESRSDDEVLQELKQSFSQRSKAKDVREKKDFNDTSKHNHTSSSSILSEGKNKGPIGKEAAVKTSENKQKKSISFSDKKLNDVIPVKGRAALSNPVPVGAPATKGIMMNRATKDDHIRNDIDYDLSNNEPAVTEEVMIVPKCSTQTGGQRNRSYMEELFKSENVVRVSEDIIVPETSQKMIGRGNPSYKKEIFKNEEKGSDAELEEEVVPATASTTGDRGNAAYMDDIFSADHDDSLDEGDDDDDKNGYLGLRRPCGLSNSPSAHSGLSGISQVLSEISDSDSSETTPTETIFPRTTKATIEVPPKSEKMTDKERVKEMERHRDRVKGSRSPQTGTKDRSMGSLTPRPGKRDKDHISPTPATKEEIPKDLEVGSMVEVLDNPPKFGVIRWIGTLPEANDPNRLIAGLEMEEEDPNSCTDGTFNGRKIFDCPPKKGFFVYLNRVRKDSRFQESVKYTDSTDSMAFGAMDSPDIPGNMAPPATLKDISNMFGKNKGIQGHHNSCYLDATLFSMFAFTQVFDTVLHRPSRVDDLTEYDEIQQVLKESIVNPLRKLFYVRADKVLKLRTLLDKLSSVNGMMGEEKDPEEFLNSLLHDTMKADPFIKLSSGQESYFYQLFIEKDEKLVLPTTQQLLGLSFLQSDIKLAEIPSCLILQMPRFGKDYKMYQRIVPSLYLDITDILENSPRECAICGDIATYECKECYKQFGDTIDRIAFCDNCIKKIHSHPDRASHKAKPIGVPEEYKAFLHEQKQLLGGENVRIHRETMELFAVVCIETSHYVAFVKCGPGPKAPWVFFDSMADRMGEQHGYNIPEVQPCRDLPDWLADDNHERILTMKEDRQLPEYARRILCDAYMCMYQSTDVMMYK